VVNGYQHVLGFNEPSKADQGDMTVDLAFELWPAFDNPAILPVSPSTSADANGQAWFADFMARLNADPSVRADFLAIHWYGWNTGSCDANASQLESCIGWAEGFAGDRPIWITESGCLNESHPDAQTVIDFCNGALAVFARHPRVMRYERFSAAFCRASQAAGKEQYLVPYFITGHPGSALRDTIALALYLMRRNLRPRQVQDFVPTPMSMATAMYYTGLDPISGEPVQVVRGLREKRQLKALLFWWDPAQQALARAALRRAGRRDLIGGRPGCLVPSRLRSPS
jgi:hypothetical protein